MPKVSRLKVELEFARYIIKLRMKQEGIILSQVEPDALDKACKYLVREYREAKTKQSRLA